MLLECVDLIKIYPGPHDLMFPALRGLNLSIKKGELISIIGPSGSGKTTLMRLISGFDKPSSGEIWFEEQLINKFTKTELLGHRKKVGVIHQEPKDNLIWDLSVIDNVMLPMRYFNLNWNIKQKGKEILLQLGLKGKEKRKPSQLSGGEQQRVAIAVALSTEPHLLLADEPTGELDSFTTFEIIEYFRRINEDLGITIIAVTHDKRFSKMSDITYKIQDGRLTTLQMYTKGEAAVVDAHGNLRLPSEVMKHFKGMSSVKVIIDKDEIRLVPFQRDKLSQQTEDN
jgi:ABC-type lipoprotein export system ATPase subunit